MKISRWDRSVPLWDGIFLHLRFQKKIISIGNLGWGFQKSRNNDAEIENNLKTKFFCNLSVFILIEELFLGD